MSKSLYIVGETTAATTTFSSGANCAGITYTGLKTLTNEDIGSKPAGTVKVSVSCLYNSQMNLISQDCSAYEVEGMDGTPSLTCELDKTSYSVGDKPNPTSVVKPNGSTCGTPSFTGIKTFAAIDQGENPAGTIKASVSCTYKSASLPIVTQNCPAFTVQSSCPDLSEYFCSTTNVVFLDPGSSVYYGKVFNSIDAICLKITKSPIREIDCSKRQCRVNAGEFFTDEKSGTFEKFPNDECGVVYLDVKRGDDPYYFGFLGLSY